MEQVTIEQLDPAKLGVLGPRASTIRDLIQNWCNTELKWATYESHNGPRLWGQVARHLNGYLGVLWVTGILRADRPRDAFRVTCDQTSMTKAEIQEGNVICQVGVTSGKGSGFIFYRIRIRLQTLREQLAVA